MDSGIDMDAPGKEKTLNPKAKEFRPPPTVAGLGPNSKTAVSGIRRPGPPERLYSQVPSPECPHNDSKPVSNSTFPPAPFLAPASDLGSSYDRRFLPPGLNIAALLQQLYGTTPSFPFLSPCSPGLSTIRPSINTPSVDIGLGGGCNFRQNFHHNENLGHPWAGCCTGDRRVSPAPTTSLGPLAGSVIPAVPTAPDQPAVGDLPRILPPALSQIPPGPVPKPRFPNARGQQAYEEWIEWRKANEPGYALECKARQARRVHRGRGMLKSTSSKVGIA